MLNEEQLRAHLTMRRAYWRWQAAKEALRLVNPAWLRRYDGPPPPPHLLDEMLDEMRQAWDAYQDLRPAGSAAAGDIAQWGIRRRAPWRSYAYDA